MTKPLTKEEYLEWCSTHYLENGLWHVKKSEEQLAKEKEKRQKIFKEWYKKNRSFAIEKEKKRQIKIRKNTIIVREEFFADERERLKQEA